MPVRWSTNSRQLKNIMGLHLKPRSDYGKITETAFHPVFVFAASPHDATGKNRDAGDYRFPESLSGNLETYMRKPSVLGSTRRIIFP